MIKKYLFILGLLPLGLAIKSCMKSKASSKPGIKINFIDTTVKPGDDFNLYANGIWLKQNPVPPTESRWGSFNEINNRNLERLRSIVNEVSSDKKATKGTDRQLVGTFYRTALDSIKADKLAYLPIKNIQDEINNIKTSDDLIKTLASLHKKGMGGCFGFYVSSDLKNSAINTQYISQGGFNLPDKDYYFQEKHETIRKEYINHIATIMKMVKTNHPSLEIDSKIPFEIETKLATMAMNAVERRNIQAQYNQMLYSEFKEKYKNINWDLYFNQLGALPFEKIVVKHLKFLDELNILFKSTNINDWKSYLQWQLINACATNLDFKTEQENFNFYETILKGTKQMKPRWKRALTKTDQCLGELLGKLFVEKYFSAEAKEKVNILVNNLTAAYRDRIKALTWMSDSTKIQALVKLDKIIRKIGYPDKWKDYSHLQISEDSYCVNVIKCNEYSIHEMLNKIGKPVDKTEWGMSSPTVNAYYSPSKNEIVFPAGIIQAPFFDANADDAANYGGIGAIIGHELTHGFDDQGSQFDGDGNMNNWWTEQDKKQFNERTALLVKQYSSYIAIDTLKVNGQLTLGENIADLGGLTMAYYAYKKLLNGKSSPIINGYTGEQRLFISWAQGWKNNIKPEALKQRLTTDPHSPANFRVIGPMSNMIEFYEAFQVKEPNKMYLPIDKRSIIW